MPGLNQKMIEEILKDVLEFNQIWIQAMMKELQELKKSFAGIRDDLEEIFREEKS